VLATNGVKDSTYNSDLSFIRKKGREEGIGAALQYTSHGEQNQFNALLLFDRKGAGQQMAAQISL
jgi:amidase